MSSAWPRLHQRLERVEQRVLLAELTSYGHAHGWAPATLGRARRSLTVLLTSQPAVIDGAMDAPMDAAAVRAFLIGRHLVALRVTEFLIDQGLVVVDPEAVLDGWLTRQLGPLPATIRAEAGTWTDALRGRGPRAGRPRQPSTIQGYVRALGPALADWSARYGSLRQVTAADVSAQLAPVTGPTRLLTLAAMRSLFTTLKARRMLFANPTAGLLGRKVPPTPALGLDPGVRAGLLARLDRPDERLIVLLAGVHALRPSQICKLTLDDLDLATGTLRINDHVRRLDTLTRQQLHATLELRRARWPATANPHLLINRSTSGGLTAVKRSYVQAVCQRLGTTAQQLRVDRLLAEVHTNGGDPLKLTQLFGLSDPIAIRYCAELGPLDKAVESARHPEFGELTAIEPTPTLQ